MDTPNAADEWKKLRRLLNLTKLSDALGLNESAAGQWKLVPENRVKQIHALLGIPPARLRPDLYPPDPWTDL